MIDKLYGKYKLICDECCCNSEEFDTFDDAVEFAKNGNGWKVRKRNGKYIDVCPDCEDDI